MSYFIGGERLYGYNLFKIFALWLSPTIDKDNPLCLQFIDEQNLGGSFKFMKDFKCDESAEYARDGYFKKTL
jgi:hypothetical protein